MWNDTENLHAQKYVRTSDPTLSNRDCKPLNCKFVVQLPSKKWKITELKNQLIQSTPHSNPKQS